MTATAATDKDKIEYNIKEDNSGGSGHDDANVASADELGLPSNGETPQATGATPSARTVVSVDTFGLPHDGEAPREGGARPDSASVAVSAITNPTYAAIPQDQGILKGDIILERGSTIASSTASASASVAVSAITTPTAIRQAQGKNTMSTNLKGDIIMEGGSTIAASAESALASVVVSAITTPTAIPQTQGETSASLSNDALHQGFSPCAKKSTCGWQNMSSEGTNNDSHHSNSSVHTHGNNHCITEGNDQNIMATHSGTAPSPVNVTVGQTSEFSGGEEEELERATRENIRHNAGAFSVRPGERPTPTRLEHDDAERQNEDRSPSGSSDNNILSTAETEFPSYNASNLPSNIDIMAEATLVEDQAYHNNVDPGSVTMSAITAPTMLTHPRQVAPQGEQTPMSGQDSPTNAFGVSQDPNQMIVQATTLNDGPFSFLESKRGKIVSAVALFLVIGITVGLSVGLSARLTAGRDEAGEELEYYCGRQECTSDQWNHLACDSGGCFTCLSRINWLQSTEAMSEEEACTRVSYEFSNDECGPKCLSNREYLDEPDPANLVWSDEFDYDGSPDSTKWDYDIGDGCGPSNCGPHKYELQNYTSDSSNVAISNGVLRIRAKLIGDSFTSARMVTRGKQSWRYGRIRFRANLANCQAHGSWPSLWMLPDFTGYGFWPSSGQIDIMEAVGHKEDVFYGGVYNEAYNPEIGTQKRGSISSSKSDWHIFEIDWQVDKIRFAVDKQVYYIYYDDVDLGWPFDQKFHILMNVAVGAPIQGLQSIVSADLESFNSTAFGGDGQYMEVDWVRVYSS